MTADGRKYWEATLLLMPRCMFAHREVDEVLIDAFHCDPSLVELQGCQRVSLKLSRFGN